jgi:23S rRNA (adenine2503-C2)-methyltransferase
MEASTRRHLLDVTPEEFAAFCAEHDLPAYRNKQVFEWVYRKGAADFDAMTNLSKPLREMLAEHWAIFTSRILRRQDSKDGTTKLLLEWPDGATSECVLIPDEERRTACISSQVGCPVGCAFCASGLAGLQRQLTSGEIVEQAMRVRQLCDEEGRGARDEGRGAEKSDEGRGTTGEDAATGSPSGSELKAQSSKKLAAQGPKSEAAAGNRLSNIVFMGLGEPLANYAAVVKAIRLINADWGMNIGARKITLSTVGLPAQIRKLAGEDLQINLALSLHAPNDVLRRKLIPWAAKIPIDDLVASICEYFERTGREATIEYILLGGVNDQPEQAYELGTLCRKMRCNVNLIRYNPVAGLGYERPGSYESQRFLQRLRERGINAHIRKSRGRDIDAACGQLRRTTAARMQAGL